MQDDIISKLVGIEGYEVFDAEYYGGLDPTTAKLKLETTEEGP